MTCPVALAALLLAADTAPKPPPPGVAHHFDVVYAEPGGAKLRLDLAVPAGRGPHPVVVGVHGGAWQFGNRKDLTTSVLDGTEFLGGDNFLDLLAVNGYAAASVSYRRAPKHTFPACLTDVRTAVRFLRTHADRYGLAADKVAVVGFSAGAHLGLLAAATAGDPAFAGHLYPGVSDRVGCVVNFFAPTDLSLYADTEGVERAFLVPLLGAAYRDDPEAYRRASPLSYADRRMPPVLTFHGTADLIVPVIHGERLHARLVAAGVASEFVAVKGKGHGWGGRAAADTTARMLKFLAAHLKGK